MKRIIATIIAAAITIALTACGTGSSAQETEAPASAAAQVQTYSASATGIGTVTVTITVQDGTILEAQVDTSNETEGIGKERGQTLAEQIVAAQNPNIDGVSGATLTSNAAKAALQQAMEQAGLIKAGTESMAAGTYTSQQHGFSHQDYLNISVTVSEDSILTMSLDDSNLVTNNSGTTADNKVIAGTAFESLSTDIIANQTLSVDAVTGATGSSSGIKNAVEDCLKQAYIAGGCTAEEAVAAINSTFRSAMEKESGTVVMDGYDIIVVGSGQAGISALLSAQQADPDAKLISIEKTAKWGGNSGGPLVFSTDVTDDEVDDAIQSYLEEVHTLRYGTDVKWDDPDYASEHADEYVTPNLTALAGAMKVSGDAANVLISYGAVYSQFMSDFIYTDATEFRTETSASSTASYVNAHGIWMEAREKFIEAGGESLLQTTANELIYEDDSKAEVIGVHCLSDDGNTYEIYGSNVILACGGFGHDTDMASEITGTDYTWGYFASPNDGEGVLMALDAGGYLYDASSYPMVHQRGPEMFMNVFDDVVEADGTVWSPNDITNALSLANGAVWVDGDGNAFDATQSANNMTGLMLAGESGPNGIANFAGGGGTLYLGPTYYTVFSDEQIAEYSENGMSPIYFGMNLKQFGVPENLGLGDYIYDALDQGIAMGFVYSASSLGELEEKLGLESGSLEAAYSEYGSATNSANSTTYYAVKGTGIAISSCAGIAVNDNMQVMGSDGTAIENLFSIGTDSIGNIMETGYEYPLGGHAAMWAISGGYIASSTALANLNK